MIESLRHLNLSLNLEKTENLKINQTTDLKMDQFVIMDRIGFCRAAVFLCSAGVYVHQFMSGLAKFNPLNWSKVESSFVSIGKKTKMFVNKYL